MQCNIFIMPRGSEHSGSNCRLCHVIMNQGMMSWKENITLVPLLFCFSIKLWVIFPALSAQSAQSGESNLEKMGCCLEALDEIESRSLYLRRHLPGPVPPFVRVACAEA